jgi:hypothetical protein
MDKLPFDEYQIRDLLLKICKAVCKRHMQKSYYQFLHPLFISWNGEIAKSVLKPIYPDIE